jgi:glycosyltransferase involved in cell wall biosynthesis
MSLQPITWAALIPAYQAAPVICSLTNEISKYLAKDHILIVDDGSTDQTAALAQSCGVQVLHRSANGGKGRALRDGFHHVLDWHPDWIICLDADGQHDPALIPKFQHLAATGEFDLIIGNRLGDLRAMPRIRRFSNRVSSILLSYRTSVELHDVQCGFRALRADMLNRLTLESDRFDIEAEMILKVWRRGGRIGWIPIPTIYRGEPSFMRKFPETLRFLKLFMRSFYESK